MKPYKKVIKRFPSVFILKKIFKTKLFLKKNLKNLLKPKIKIKMTLTKI